MCHMTREKSIDVRIDPSFRSLLCYCMYGGLTHKAPSETKPSWDSCRTPFIVKQKWREHRRRHRKCSKVRVCMCHGKQYTNSVGVTWVP